MAILNIFDIDAVLADIDKYQTERSAPIQHKPVLTLEQRFPNKVFLGYKYTPKEACDPELSVLTFQEGSTANNHQISNIDLTHSFRNIQKKYITKIKQKQFNCYIEDIGCTIAVLIDHIEKQFKFDMTWENHGVVWHFDHIIPLCSVNYLDGKRIRQILHYTNLQPLFIEDHRRKSPKDKKKRALNVTIDLAE